MLEGVSVNSNMWINYFSRKIATRGRQYYRNGAVKELIINSDGTNVTALVNGRTTYHVEIALDKHMLSVNGLNCDCPYAESGFHCKHMAAVLYALEKKHPSQVNFASVKVNSANQLKSPEESDDTLFVEKDWRFCFSDSVLRQAKDLFKKQKITGFSATDTQANAIIATSARVYHICIANTPHSYGEEWNPLDFSCDCGSKMIKVLYLSGKKIRYASCAHQAVVLMYWEQQHGPWRFKEPSEIREDRLKKEQQKREEILRKAHIQEEKQRRQKLREQYKNMLYDPAEFFVDETGENTFFDVKKAASHFNTTPYYIKRAKILLESGTINMSEPTLDFDTESGQQVLYAQADVGDDIGNETASVEVGKGDIIKRKCTCQPYYFSSYSRDLCEHQLVVLEHLREYVTTHNPGDATNLAAHTFFERLDNLSPHLSSGTDDEPLVQKEACVVLTPRITVDDDEVMYTFRVGRLKGKQVFLSNIEKFMEAYESQGDIVLSKTMIIDFSREDFTAQSLAWAQFLQRKLSETEEVNRRISDGYYYRPSVSVKSRELLFGATLDRFYDLAENSVCEYHNNATKTQLNIPVGHSPLHIRLVSVPLKDEKGVFIGSQISGQLPVILKGIVEKYALSQNGLSRLTKEESLALEPFQSAANSDGTIDFHVGKDNLAELYYRVIPHFMHSDYVEYEDTCADEVDALLPPEPKFTFCLDMDEAAKRIICEVFADYDNIRYNLLAPKHSEYRDNTQENRVIQAINEYFPETDISQKRFYTRYSDERHYKILTQGMQSFSRYGQVQGSDAFEKTPVRPVPQIRMNISTDSGLLELSILSKDVSAQELLEILESYHQKKNFHRLYSGAFISLGKNEQLDSIESITQALGLRMQDVTGEKIELPVYRAIYLNSLLEKHDSLVNSRDRTYRALIKNFKTIRDSDYDVPETLSDTLRPYQVYGYKWLCTLSAAGFGGILADEMGLGKTLQSIALLQSAYESGLQKPSLIVCPAGLIYNWKEEFEQFAPRLNTSTITGTPKARKQKLQQAVAENAVCITGYDLLRQDFSTYSKINFSYMFIDEAQYIKNQKAALTKAVKAIQAEKRFALTGTPIENRLAELWSIFDFIMPGFLYSYSEFSQCFEMPITKQKDSGATERLRQMVSPFILRRLKTDVLKDLPPKLEEVRYTHFEAKQRKVYDGQVVRMTSMIKESTGKDKIKIFAELMRIRQICCDPSLLFDDYDGGSAKRTACMELIRDAVSGNHRLLVFSQFASMLELLETDLKAEKIPFFKITGGTPKQQRAKLVRQFNQGDTPVFLISLKAGGTGLNLTGADVVIHYDPWWNLAAQNQATDRAHRIGQQNVVTVYRLIVKGTIEEKILALQQSKHDLADSILSGEHTSLSSLSNEELLDLLQ